MSELAEKPLEERLAETAEKLTKLEEAAWAALAAMESGNPDEIAKAKRQLGLVFLDL